MIGSIAIDKNIISINSRPGGVPPPIRGNAYNRSNINAIIIAAIGTISNWPINKYAHDFVPTAIAINASYETNTRGKLIIKNIIYLLIFVNSSIY